uniref:Glyceraldehyde-3-phosphate dehydrogenase n=1 Tax=Aeropyrum pernix TaxID=56636 RepID=Q18MV6_AERPX|nr:glyceraldehyde 3-phosphate dehydrogenase [Aeropyrum pernix]
MSLMSVVKVGVNGFGTIGRRVALAITLQKDLKLVDVVKRTPDYAALYAASRGIPIYTPTAKEAEEFEKRGIKVGGTLRELLARVDVIVDATPEGQGAKNKPLYREAGVKQVYQGGEKPEVAEASFSTLCNYEESKGKGSLRVVSCNTTGLLRLICTLNREFGVESVRAVLVRRGADPKEVKRGPIDSIVLNPPTLPSHHAVDVRTVLPWLDIKTAAVAVPTTFMHMHHVTLKLAKPVERREVLETLASAPRIMLVSSGDTGIKSTSQLVDAARLSRMGYDIPELVVFEESVAVDGREVMLFQAVHQESIVVPENIDAIRAVASSPLTLDETLKATDGSLDLRKTLW